MRDKKVVFLFGRFQVPTKGHAEMIMYGADYARRTGAEFRLYTSKSHDGVKNPLPYKAKIAFLRQLFPGVNVVDDPSAVTAFAICRKLSDQGYTDVTMVTGGDRVDEFKTQIGRYVMDKKDPKFDPKKNYAFKKFNVVNSGNRKAGISGTQMREFIRGGKFNEFMKIAPTNDKKLAKTIFDTAKKNLIKEDTESIAEVTTRHITKHLSSNGWKKDREGSNHEVWKHEKSGKSIAVPRHRGDLKKGLAQGIMKSAMIAEDVTRKEFEHHLKAFIKFACDHLGIKQYPRIKYKKPADQGEQPSFAAYSPSQKLIYIMTKNRHPMDVFRSIAHELVHHKQGEDNRLNDVASAGGTGSDIENEANSEAGVIMRLFGKKHPHMFGLTHVVEETDMLSEGIYDPHIFKAIFLAGGAGSGKDYILNSVIKNNDPYSNGLKELNIDQAFKHLLVKAGLSLIFKDEEEEARNAQRAVARVSHQKNTALKLGGRMGVIINGTADDYQKISKLKSDYERLGYDTMMIFVSTNNKVSRQRNIERGQKGDRALANDIRFRTWRDAMNNKDKFASLFGRNFIAIDNSIDTRTATPDQKAMIERTHKQARQMVNRFINAPINDTAKAWIASQKKARGINEKFEDMLMEVGGAGNWGTPMLTDRYKADTPGQEPGKTRQMGYYPSPNVKVFGNAPINGDALTGSIGSSKSATFNGDTTTSDFNSLIPMAPVDKWMMKEETRRRFKEKYGQLAEKKMRETVRRLMESQDKQ